MASAGLVGFDVAVAVALRAFLDSPAAEATGRKVAVFDADGTLWRGDIGEAFFRHQVAMGSIPNAPGKDPWEFYLKESIQGDAAKAYGWLAQWNAGVREADLDAWCDEYYARKWAQHAFAPMRELVAALTAAGFEIWLISGSPRWIVQAGAKTFGIRRDRVLGSSVHVENGRLTDRIENEVPYRAGKSRLVAKIIGTSPLFAAGNTFWDHELLLTATGPRLAIHSEHKGEPNYESEQKLQTLAKANGWLSQRFY